MDERSVAVQTPPPGYPRPPAAVSRGDQAMAASLAERQAERQQAQAAALAEAAQADAARVAREGAARTLTSQARVLELRREYALRSRRQEGLTWLVGVGAIATLVGLGLGWAIGRS